MLYVFHVDTGTMMTFDMSLALESVGFLKLNVERECKIPVDKQVLLVSGGESLDERCKVCTYSAGTDTNPIYLFSKSVIESATPPCTSVDYGSDYDFKSRVREAQDMPATYETVVLRAQLAQQFHESAKHVTKICEGLVHDQHLQQQGWSAVIANLEDLTDEFKKRSSVFETNFNDYLAEHDNYVKFLEFFNKDLQILAKIPVIPSLLEYCKLEQEGAEEETGEVSEESEPATANSDNQNITLLEWISAADSRSTMDQLLDHCTKGLEQFDEKIFLSLHEEIENAVKASNQSNMKEVKGLGDRLYGLEQLMLEAKRYVGEQADLAKSFLKNQNRAGNLGDTSILPDLCDSHRKQLVVMLNNHEQLCDIRKRCIKAKDELSVNLYHRLRWVMYVENLMLDANHKLFIYHDNLKRLRKHLEVVQQIHLAPATYLSAVAEVVRRRSFSQAFLLWASELACHLLTIHNEEVTKRKEFQSVFEGHFLNALFPGMEDLPPNFATQAPSIFDSSLPKITDEDVENLREVLPELTENLTVPDMSSITNFFLVKSMVKNELDKADDRGMEEKLVQVVNEVGLASNLDQKLLKTNEGETYVVHGIPHLKDIDKGCESETDTEEFEKVCQSPLELQFDKELSSPRPGLQDASTLTEDNLQTSRTEYDRLKGLIVRMAVLSREAMAGLRTELCDIRSFYVSQKSSLEAHYSSLSNSWDNLATDMDSKERELRQKIGSDYEGELTNFKKLVGTNNDEIKCLRDENVILENNLRKASEENKDLLERISCMGEGHGKEVEDLEKRVAELELDKDRAVREATESLSRQHRAELENLRTRFKLVSSRTPSDPNLNKTDEESIKGMVETERQNAIASTLQSEAEKWERILEEMRNDVVKKISEEKNKQIQVLREQVNSLQLECLKHKNMIHQLSSFEAERSSEELLNKVEALEKEKCHLEAELSQERSRRFDHQDMTASVAVCEGTRVDAATSPVKYKDKLTKSQTSLVKSSKLNIESCNTGDAVLIIWDSIHENYTVLQETNYLYFLNTDCLDTLGLRKPNADDKRTFYCTGEVIEKEYCHAKKNENRYNVPKGTKFYRVKVKPLSSAKEINRTSEPSVGQPAHMTQSQTASRADTSSSALDSTCLSLPTSPTKTNQQQRPDKNADR